MIAANGRRRPRRWTSGPDSPQSWEDVLLAFKAHLEGEPMAAQAAAQAETVVDATPEQAFRLFTDEIGLWWRQRTPYWNDPERGLYIRIEPGVGGRFIEVYDPDTDTGFEAGRVTAWEPGRRLGLTWTQVGWPDDVFTDIEVTFEPAGAGTRVRITQTGFERVGPEAAGARAGYESGWREVIGWFAEHVSAHHDPDRRSR